MRDITARTTDEVRGPRFLPPVPGSALLTTLIHELAEARDTLSPALVNRIHDDSGLLHPLLEIVNGTYYGRSARVYTLQDAIHRLGILQTKTIAVYIVLRNTFTTEQCPKFSLRRYWIESLTLGRCALHLADLANKRLQLQRERTYTLGPLARFGLPALVSALPRVFSQVLGRPRRHLRAAERSQLGGLDQYDAGAHTLTHWDVDGPVRDALRQWNTADCRPPIRATVLAVQHAQALIESDYTYQDPTLDPLLGINWATRRELHDRRTLENTYI